MNYSEEMSKFDNVIDEIIVAYNNDIKFYDTDYKELYENNLNTIQDTVKPMGIEVSYSDGIVTINC